MRDATASEAATLIEGVEMDAWKDCVAAAPADYVAREGLTARPLGAGLAVACRNIAIPLFNRVMGLGVAAPATEAEVTAARSLYESLGVRKFMIHYVPAARPEELAHWLRAVGLKPRGNWDRIIRRGDTTEPPAITLPPGMVTESVTPDTAAEWAGFIDSTYGLETAPWLLSLVGRKGWRHVILRERGQIAAARSMYVSGRHAWMGIESPVPGVMTQSYGLDRLLTHALVRHGLASGVDLFVADIEHTESGSTPAYANFAELGFEVVYRRVHFAP